MEFWLRNQLTRNLRRILRQPVDLPARSMFLLPRHFTRPEPPESHDPDRYNAREAEPRWQKLWDERGIFAAENNQVRNRH